MKRSERNELREQQHKANFLVESIDEFLEYFKTRSIGFRSFHVVATAQIFKDSLAQYSAHVTETLRYRK